MAWIKRSLLIVSVLSGVYLTPAWADIVGGRLWHAPDNSRLVFDLSKGVEHKIFSLSSPDRLVIDVENSQMLASMSALPTESGPVRKVRWANRGGNDLRIVLDLRHGVNPKSFHLKPNEQYGHRLVVDLYNREGQSNPATVSSIDGVDTGLNKAEAILLNKPVLDEKSLTRRRDIVIAIDAGHGGEDPGAVGHGRVYEKRVVLAIAKEIEKLLAAERGFKPKLVRTGDYYIGLRERTRIARKASADLFISIHADAFHSPKAKGASVFALSQRGATSEAARWLADKENASDLIGGVGGVSLDDKEDLLAGVLLDLSITASLGVSLDMGQKVLNSMGSVSKLHKRRVEQAGFAVLKSPDIPSLLIETGFLSNPSEARNLASSTYQKRMARSIFNGIKEYFYHAPPPGTYIASVKNRNKGQHLTAASEYVIEPGDTLSVIAQRHATSTTALRKLNGLKSDSLRVGQKLKIPAS